MSSVSASDFKNVTNLNYPNEDIEYILDLAIDTLNIYGNLSLDNMSGSAGSKTVDLTGRERAAVFHTARAIYQSFFKEPATVSLAGLTVSISDLMSNPTVEASVRLMAKKLSGIAFKVGEDTSGM